MTFSSVTQIMQRLWRMDMNMEQWWNDRQRQVTGNKVSIASSPRQMELARHQPETYSLNRAGKRSIE
jgi:hypothetical protein